MPRPVQDELERLGERWRQLPATQALAFAAELRALAQNLADGLADQSGARRAVLGDLGPAVALDQVTVLVYDAAAAGLGEGLGEQLRDLRRRLP